MERDYNLQDPTDLEILKSDFEFFSADEWQEMIEYTMIAAHKRKFSYDERGILMQARKKALYKGYPTAKQMLWALKVADKIEAIQNSIVEEE
jgi:exodeoxyribonuclease V alpha subunit